jgi:hypothetical protein
MIYKARKQSNKHSTIRKMAGAFSIRLFWRGFRDEPFSAHLNKMRFAILVNLCFDGVSPYRDPRLYTRNQNASVNCEELKREEGQDKQIGGKGLCVICHAHADEKAMSICLRTQATKLSKASTKILLFGAEPRVETRKRSVMMSAVKCARFF